MLLIFAGTLYRVNAHIKWSIMGVFNWAPNASYAIILEDDLDLSPDFMKWVVTFLKISKSC